MAKGSKILLFFLIAMVFAITKRSNNQLSRKVEQEYLQEIALLYKEAINAGDFSIIEPYISESFTFGTNPTDISKIVVPAVFNAHIMTINQIIDIRAKAKADTIELIMNLDIIAMGSSLETEDKMVLVFEEGEYRILSLGEGTLQTMVIKDPVKDLTFEITGANKTKLRFIDNPTHILIPARFPDKSDSIYYFILDSGAPMTIINSPYVDMFEPIEETGQMLGKTHGVGGEINVDKDFRVIQELALGDIKLSGIKALSVDLKHLERALGQEFIGLIGVDVIGKFITTINYRNRELYLARNRKDMDELLAAPVVEVINFEQKLHLMTTTAELPIDSSIHIMNKQIISFSDESTGESRMSVRIALDSGAGAGLFCHEVFNLVPEKSIQIGTTDTLIGAGLAYQLAQVRYIEGLKIGKISRDDYPVVEADISYLTMNENTIIDGLLGLNFFDNYLITLNYNTKSIELRELPKKEVE
ncbi:MAG: aspartyl protease family protein [Candidatus Zixiibacteriota bacterium]